MASYNEYKNKKGKFWEYRTFYKCPLTGKKREKNQKQFLTKKEAQKACEAFERDLQEGFTEDNMLLKDFIEYWLQSHKKSKIKESTLENKECQIKNHILPYFQNIKLVDIKPKFYQTFIDEFAEKGYSRSTIENSHWILHAVFERAKLEKKIKENPAEIATLKGREKSNFDLEYIPSNLIQNLLDEAAKDRFEYFAYFYCLVETGLRKGEAAGLTWEDLDFENNKINVNKSMCTQKGNFTSTKTKSSIRVVDVPERLMQVLKKLKIRQQENRFAWGEKYDTKEMNLVFCRPKGEFYPKSTLHNAFNRYQKKTGIFAGTKEDGKPKLYAIHALRHSHAVMCLENEMDFKTLQERLGHGSYDVTMDVYAHVSNKMKKKNMEKYEKGTADLFRPMDLRKVSN